MKKFGDNATTMYVGTLTADEIVYAGADTNYIENYTYLLNEYQKSESLEWWTISPGIFRGDQEIAFSMTSIGNLEYFYSNNYHSLRPAIILKSNITITDGVGTIDDPYIVG